MRRHVKKPSLLRTVALVVLAIVGIAGLSAVTARYLMGPAVIQLYLIVPEGPAKTRSGVLQKGCVPRPWPHQWERQNCNL